nr:hypothetical protein [Nocardioides sp.]
MYAARALTSYAVASQSGPHRKYDGMTPLGRAQLKSQRDDWVHFSATVTNLLRRASPVTCGGSSSHCGPSGGWCEPGSRSS